MKRVFSLETWFGRIALRIAAALGSATAFLLAIGITLVWLITGPVFHFSNAWQFVINTVTNVFTLLMVFIIQNTQNRDTAALHLKLDELIRAVRGARNDFIDVEERPLTELTELKEEFKVLCEETAEEIIEHRP